jgi:Dolichyl-phosphate-mannose-protein mannosyltransferase
MFARLKAYLATPGTGFRAPMRIFWIGLVVRLLYITLAHTYRVRLILDHFQFGWEMGRIARAVVTGHGYSDPFLGPSGPTAWIAPLYPLLLAGVFKLFGVYTAQSAWVILAINSVFSAGTALAVYEIAARCYEANSPARKIALWSAWLWALYPAAIQYAVHWIWDMSITTFLLAWALVLALRVRAVGEQNPQDPAHQTTQRWAVFGLLWGLIALSNPSLFLFLPACVFWMLWGLRFNLRSLSRTLGKAILAAVIVSACMAPWIWRNWRTFHAFIPTRGNMGAELYQSTLEQNNGFSWGPTLPLAVDAPEFVRYKTIGEVAYVKEKNEQAKVEMRKRPRRIVDWTVKRIYFFWAGVPHPFEKHPSVEIVREMNYSILSITGVLGLLLSLRRRVPGSWLFAFAFLLIPLVYYAVTVQARFRHTMEPLIAIFTVFLFQSAERRGSKVAAQPELAEQTTQA